MKYQEVIYMSVILIVYFLVMYFIMSYLPPRERREDEVEYECFMIYYDDYICYEKI